MAPSLFSLSTQGWRYSRMCWSQRTSKSNMIFSGNTLILTRKQSSLSISSLRVCGYS